MLQRERRSDTDHRRVESGHLGVVDLTAAVLLLVTRRDEGDDPLGVRGCFHVRQAFSPGARRDEPHEGEHGRHHKVLPNTHTRRRHGLPTQQTTQ